MDQPVALSLGGPHAWLNLISFAAGQRAIIGGDQMLPDEAALNALHRLGEIARRAPPGTETLNPIQLLNAMGQSDEIALIPLIFGYVTYAKEGHTPMPVKFSNSIRAGDGFGGVLGGTGSGSAGGDAKPELLDHIAWVMTPDVSGICSWLLAVNLPRGRPGRIKRSTRTGTGLQDTEDTAENALLRPCFDGYIAFVTAASALIRVDFRDKIDETQTLQGLRRLLQVARETARGGLDDERMVDD